MSERMDTGMAVPVCPQCRVRAATPGPVPSREPGHEAHGGAAQGHSAGNGAPVTGLPTVPLSGAEFLKLIGEWLGSLSSGARSFLFCCHMCACSGHLRAVSCRRGTGVPQPLVLPLPSVC